MVTARSSRRSWQDPKLGRMATEKGVDALKIEEAQDGDDAGTDLLREVAAELPTLPER